MAGHSKWANIKHRKAATDAKRGKVFTRLIKEITVASRMGGKDQSSNSRLRLAVLKAREQNMPNDTIERAVKRGAGELEGAQYEEIRYEGYGVAGVPFIVDCLTDNRVRTVSEVRHAFSKNGGNLGTDGSVAFLFKHCGLIIIAPGLDETKIFDLAIEAGAEDIQTFDDGSIEIITSPDNYHQVSEALTNTGIKPDYSELTMKVLNEIEVSAEDKEKLEKLYDALENLDDVQNVFTAVEI